MKIIYSLLIFGLLLFSTKVSTQKSSEDLTKKIEAMAKIGACYSPSFSPDGKEIVFISNISGLPQLWKIPSTGG